MKLEHVIQLGLEGKLALSKLLLPFKWPKYDPFRHLGVATHHLLKQNPSKCP